MDWLKSIKAVCLKTRVLSVRPLPSSLRLLLRRNKGFRGANWEGRKAIGVWGDSTYELRCHRIDRYFSILEEVELIIHHLNG